jgi:hypothetical protein
MAKKFLIQQLYAMHEVSYATDPDADGSDYKFIKTVEPASFTPAVEVIERPGMTGDLVRQEHVLGAKGGQLTFKVEMKGAGTPASDNTASIASESSPFIEAACGTVFRGTGSIVAAGSTASVINVTAADGVGFRRGMMVEIAGQVRFISSIATDALTLDRALSGVPANGTAVYASSMFTRANSGHKSMAFVIKIDGVEYTLLGCKVAVAIEGAASGGTALLAVTVDVGTWSTSTKASLPSSATLSGVNAVKAPVVKGATCAVANASKWVREFVFNPGMEISFIASTEATDNKAGIEAVQSNPTGAIKPYHADQHMTDFAAGTVNAIAFAAGAAATVANGWGVYVQRAQYLQPTWEDGDGMLVESLPFACVDNGTDAEYYLCQF